jgi:histidinol-phosphate aminotransferase
MSDAALRALIAARVPTAIAELHPYVPDPTVVPVRLDANEAPPLLPTLDDAERAAFQQALLAVEPARYPDVRAEKLRRVLAMRCAAHPSQLVIGCGSDEVIAMLLSTLARPIDGAPASIVVPTPTFVMYRVSARVHGLDVIEVPLDAAFDLDEGAIIEAIRARRPAVVFLATPNNPTSAAFDRGRVQRIVDAAEANDPPTVVVIDEAYLPFRLGDADPWAGDTGLSFLARSPHVVVLRTLSKIGLAALRVGWMIAHPLLVAEVEKVRLPYDLPSYSQAGAVAALTSLSRAIDRHVTSIVTERARLVHELDRERLEHPRADANFVWLKLPRPAADVVAGLKARGVMVRGFAAYPDRLRVTVGTPAQDDRFLEELRATLRA